MLLAGEVCGDWDDPCPGDCAVTVPLLFGGNRDDQSSLFSGGSDGTVSWDDQSLSFLGISAVAGYPVTGDAGVTNVWGLA